MISMEQEKRTDMPSGDKGACRMAGMGCGRIRQGGGCTVRKAREEAVARGGIEELVLPCGACSRRQRAVGRRLLSKQLELFIDDCFEDSADLGLVARDTSSIHRVVE